MSIAARRSHRGDEYQLKIALHWITRLILEDEEWEWVQIETITIPGQEEIVSVDDVVVCHSDGTYRFIQAKKNQTDRRNWSVSDLKDELLKTRDQLEKGPKGRVRFYSRTPFGELGKFLEDTPDFETYDSFIHNAPTTLKDTLSKLSKIIDRDKQSTFDLFLNVDVGPHHTFDDWDDLIIKDLKRFTHDPGRALSILEGLARKNQAGLGGPFRLTRDNLISALIKNGLPLSPSKTEEEIIKSFREASRIGRDSTSRDIANIKIDRGETNQIISLLEKDMRKIVLTGPPGCGKSWILLELADFLETQDQWGMLYIRGDHFDDIDSEGSINSRLNLQDDIVGLAGRLSSYRKPVVIIDSLDALSLARDQKALKIFLALLDRLAIVEGISIIAACRNFDLDYDPLLRDRKWDKKINVSNLDFGENVAPILKKWGIDPEKIHEDQMDLLTIPRNLKLFERIADKIPIESLTTSYNFADSFIEEIVIKNKTLGNKAFSLLQDMAAKLMDRRSLFLFKDSFDGDEQMLRSLKSEGVLQEDTLGKRIAFTHQTLIDTLAARKAIAEGQSLESFILSYPPLPFIRPSVRTFLFYLRSFDRKKFLGQVEKIFDNPEIAYHLKRLIAESLAEIKPCTDDLKLFKWILANHTDHFRRFLVAIKGPDWFDLFAPTLFKQIITDPHFDNLKLYFTAKLREWMNIRPKEVVDFWSTILADDMNIVWEIGSSLNKFEKWETAGIYDLLALLISKGADHSRTYFGNAISKHVEKMGRGDELLWKFITLNIKEKKIDSFKLDNYDKGLICGESDFHNKVFLKMRMCSSDYLLSTATKSIETWSANSPLYGDVGYRDVFLSYTSWRFRHERHDTHHAGRLSQFFSSISFALQERSKKNDRWWHGNKKRLNETQEEAIIYLLIHAYKANIKDNVSDIVRLLQRQEVLLDRKLSHELGELIHDVFPYLSYKVQEDFQVRVSELKSPYDDEEKEMPRWLVKLRYQYLCNIPTIFRLVDVVNFIEHWKKEFGEWPIPPHIYSRGGWVRSPISTEQMLSLSDETLIRLFQFYDQHNRDSYEHEHLVGGTEAVVSTFRDCCALDPARFIPFFDRIVSEEILNKYAISVMEGIAYHIRYRFGNLQPPSKEWKPKEPLLVGKALGKVILKRIYQYKFLWKKSYKIAEVVKSCCHVLEDPADVELVIFCQFRLANHQDPEAIKQRIFSKDKKDISGDDLAVEALNSIRGITAEGSILLALNLLKSQKQLHELLFPLMLRFATDSHPAVRVSILNYLPYYAHYDFDGAWKLYHAAFQKPHILLWSHGEHFLSCQYHSNFDKVRPYLDRIEKEAIETAGESWGRISTLSYLSEHLSDAQLFNDLDSLNNNNAWIGAVQVFRANISNTNSQEKCEKGLLYIINNTTITPGLLNEIDSAFEQLNADGADITLLLARKYISAFEDVKGICKRLWFYDWLSKLSNNEPFSALQICENLLSRIEESKSQCHIWQGEKLISSAIRILREADLVDDPDLISRAILLQDQLLRLNLGDMSKALDEAARS